MQRYEYEHIFIQYMTEAGEHATIPLGVTEGLNAWGSDGWQVVHMEGVWDWHQQAEGKSWPETLRGYYVTFRREAEAGGGRAVATAAAEVLEEAMMSTHTPAL